MKQIEIAKFYSRDELCEIIEYLTVLVKFYEVAGLPEDICAVQVILDRFKRVLPAL